MILSSVVDIGSGLHAKGVPKLCPVYMAAVEELYYVQSSWFSTQLYRSNFNLEYETLLASF